MSDRPSFTETLRRIGPVAYRHRWVLSLSLVVTVLGGLLQLTLPIGIKLLFDSISQDGEGLALGFITTVLVAIFLGRAALTFFAQYHTQTVGEKITFEMRQQLLEHYSGLPRSYHLNNPTSQIITHIYNDSAEVRNILAVYLVTILALSIQIVGAVVIMTSMNFGLALVVIALGPLSTIVTLVYGRKLHGLGGDIKDRLINAMTFAQEYVANAYIVKIFDHNRGALEVFRDRLKLHLKAAVAARRIDASRYAIITLLTALSTIGIFWYGGKLVQQGELSTGALVAFFLYSQGVSQAISTLASTFSALSQATGAVSKLFTFLEEPQERALSADGIEFVDREASFRFENVTFGYCEDRPVLCNLNLDVPSGKTVLAQGPSGIGKSTLLSLIARYNDPQTGRILLNGIDLKMYDISSLRKSISIVAQDVMLFSTTIMENIRFGNPAASDEEIVEAAKVANAHEFIVELKDGYDTYVGERAVQLSGGQRQRISIARAVVRQAPILILDEATSSVDDASALQITEALNRIKAGRTTFVVSHREIGQLGIDLAIDLAGSQVRSGSRTFSGVSEVHA